MNQEIHEKSVAPLHGQDQPTTSRPIILNRRSLSNSRLVKKKHSVETPSTTFDTQLQPLNIPNSIDLQSLSTSGLAAPGIWKTGNFIISEGNDMKIISQGRAAAPTVPTFQSLSCFNQISMSGHSGTVLSQNSFMYNGNDGARSCTEGRCEQLVLLSANPSDSLHIQNPPNHGNVTLQLPSAISYYIGKENLQRQLSIPPSVQSTFNNKLVDMSQLQPNCNLMMNENVTKENFMNDSLSAISWVGQMDADAIVPSLDAKRNFEVGRPPYSYMALIQFAINSSPNRRMTLRQIYSWIEETFPYFKHAKPGWKNSIRHNLSLHDIFVREVSQSSKSSYWTLRPDLNHRPLTLACVAARMGNTNPFALPLVASKKEPTDPLQMHSSLQPSAALPQHSGTSSTKNEQRTYTMDSPPSKSSLGPPIKEECFETSTPRVRPCEKRSACPLNLNNLPVSPFEKQNKKEESTGRKRRRKQPLETLNDSLNDSLHFTESISSPLVIPLPPDEEPEVKPVVSHKPITIPSLIQIRDETAASTSESESGYFEQTCSSTQSFNLASRRSRGQIDKPADSAPKIESVREAMVTQVNPCKQSDSGRESPLVDGLPQIFGGEAFSFNSSFAKLLNSSNVSLFNLSDRSVQFSDFEDM